jgi:hydroxyethylthiazole kinase-like uncharacterized protein yjeF
MNVLTAAQMREVDRLTIDRYGIPGLLLMETAAARTIEATEKEIGPLAAKHALVICGRGNNGGDGAAIARGLYTKGARATVILLGSISDTRGDARTNFEIVQAISKSGEPALDFVEIRDTERLEAAAYSGDYDLVFDAIFGTGLARPASGISEAAIEVINHLGGRLPVISVDIPSGLASDSAELIGPCVSADLTITFTAPKIANVLPPACYECGDLVMVAIGSPSELIHSSGARLNLIEPALASLWLAVTGRDPDANKGDLGKVLIVAGSRGKTGAACLAGAAAMRSGTGLVTIATPDSALAIVAGSALVECMTEPLPETSAGTVSLEAAERVLELASQRDVIALGPGLGASDESTRAFVRAVVNGRQRPLILDADGLNALAPWPAELAGSDELPLILTPHPGEMARLTALSISEVLEDRVRVASSFAAAHHVILVLKGSRTLIALPDGEVFINPTGNSGMATGGTGDVLTGLLGGLVAQDPNEPAPAVIAGVCLHGQAGDLAASRLGKRAMLASDIIASLGDAFSALGGPDERPRKEQSGD